MEILEDGKYKSYPGEFVYQDIKDKNYAFHEEAITSIKNALYINGLDQCSI